jgi:hypothetical protein
MPKKKKTSKRKYSKKGASTLKKVNALAKKMYKKGTSGKSWKSCQKAAGKQIRNKK